MSEFASSSTASSKGKRVLLQLIVGAAAGAFGMLASLWVLEGRMSLMDQPERVLAIGTALVFGLMALMVGLGTLAPTFGARMLNVEDSEELAEQRSNLLVGAVSFALVAGFLAVLALANSEAAQGLLDSRTAGVGALVVGLALVVWGIIHRNKGDEMMRAAAKDAGALTTNLLFLVFGTWAAAAHLELVAMFGPLLFVSGFFALYLLAVFVAVAQRGLLKPR